MKSIQFTKLISLTAIVLAGFVTTNPVYSDSTCSWSGHWNTNNGSLILTQNGNDINGKFVEKLFEVKGKANGRFFLGDWAYSEASENKTGRLNLIMSEDCTSFKGDRSNNLEFQGDAWKFNSIHGKRNLKNNVSNPSNVVSSSDSRKKIFEIKNIPVSFEIDENWTYEIDKDKNILFTSKIYPDTIAIYLINEVFSYSNNNEKQMFLDSQLKEARKTAKGEVKTSSKPLNGKNVDIIEVPLEGMKTVIFMPDTGKNYFMLTATYSNPKHMVTAEPLLLSIMKATLDTK